VSEIDERVDAMVLDDFRADWRRAKLHNQQAWDAFTEDHHHLACCAERTVDRTDATEETLGGCAEGTCDVWTEVTVGITCPHGARSSHTYDATDMVDMVRRLIEREGHDV
jgi:hypothetical protein